MRRSAASRKSSAVPPQTQDIEPTEREPECLPQEQHTDMLEQEETEEAVAEHMEKLLEKVMDKCLRMDIRLQLFPYTANWVKKYLVQMVEGHFLYRDEGNGPEDVVTEDSEPPPADPDAWAQGCVPLVTISVPLEPISPKKEDVVYKKEQLEGLPKCRALPKPEVSPKLPSKKTSSKPAVVTGNTLYNSFPQPKTEKKNGQVPKRAELITFLPPLSHSIEKGTSKTSKSEVENRMSTVSNKSIPSKASNKHKAIQKLNPASLPDHCIFPKYEIVDSIVKPRKLRENNPQQKHMHPGQRAQPQICEVEGRPKHGAVISSGPFRLETMTLSKGVTLSQSGGMSRITAPPQTPPLKLNPIRIEPVQLFSAKQFVPDPQVKPLPLT